MRHKQSSQFHLQARADFSQITKMSMLRELTYLTLLYSFAFHIVNGLSIVTTVQQQQEPHTIPDEGTNLMKNATNPVVYNKLRHDRNNLQVFRRYQLKKTHLEKSKELKLNESFDDGTSKEVSYTYYENTAIEADSITVDDLILEALDRTYKTRLLPVNLHNYDNPRDRLDSSDPSLISASKCERELNYLTAKLADLERAHQLRHNTNIEPELAAFFDSFAGEEPGLLFGNYHWTGNWRQCYKRLIFDLDRSNSSNTIAFRGRYCTVSIRSRTWDKQIKEKTSELLDNYFKYPEQRYDYARFFRIQLGLCLPESCDSRSIDTHGHAIRRLALYKLNEPFKSYDLADLYCLPDETSKLRRIDPMGWQLIVLASSWCFMIVLATFVDYRTMSSNKGSSNRSKKRAKGSPKADVGQRREDKSFDEKLISALSLIKNFHRLTETKSLLETTKNVSAPLEQQKTLAQSNYKEESPNNIVSPRSQNNQTASLAPNDLLFLNAYKVISMPLIIYGHVGMLSVHLNRFPLDYESFGSDALFHFSSSTVFFVDWYFITTGFLTSYIMFVSRKVERNRLLDWIYSVFHRYWRLAPLYILLFWFQRHLFQHTSHGPIWDYATSNTTIRSVCRRESWLWPLALASNLHPIHEECIMPAWYIANDMQFYLITPFILIGLLKRPRATWIVTLSAIGASIMGRILVYLTDSRIQPLELMRPGFDLYMRNNWDSHATYVYPQYRISSYLIGILAGHYAYKVIRGDWRSPLYVKRQLARRSHRQDNKSADESSVRRSQILGRLMWIVGFQTVLYMAFATWPIKDYFPRSLEPQVKYFIASIYGFSHSTAALGMALMFLSLIFGHFACIRRFLTLPFWTLISRINYIVFLIQVEVIYWIYQSGERVPDFSGREAFKYWLQLVFLCYSLSTVLTLLIELPLAHLEREFIGSWMAARSKTSLAPSKKKFNLYEKVKSPKSEENEQCEMTKRTGSSQQLDKSNCDQSTQGEAS